MRHTVITVPAHEKIYKLYKYRTFTKYTDEIITKSSLWYANPLTFNDPFDMNPSFRKAYSKREIKVHIKDFVINSEDTRNLPFEVQQAYREEFEKRSNTSAKFVQLREELFNDQISKTGVVSLSKHKDSILMWSHYAHNHEGLVFEFDYTGKRFDLHEFPHSVQYVQGYGLLSHATNREERKKQMETILLSKYVDWAYEGEYRIIDFDFQGNKPFNKKLLTKIIFGLKASPDNMRKMVNLCKEHGFDHVQFEKAERVDGSFSLKFVPFIPE